MAWVSLSTHYHMLLCNSCWCDGVVSEQAGSTSAGKQCASQRQQWRREAHYSERVHRQGLAGYHSCTRCSKAGAAAAMLTCCCGAAILKQLVILHAVFSLPGLQWTY